MPAAFLISLLVFSFLRMVYLNQVTCIAKTIARKGDFLCDLAHFTNETAIGASVDFGSLGVQKGPAIAPAPLTFGCFTCARRSLRGFSLQCRRRVDDAKA